MRKLYDLAVKSGTYEKNGETKGRYVNVGAMMEGDNGPFLFINAHVNFAAFPRREGSESCIVSMFEPKPRDGDGYDWKGAEDRQRAASNGKPPADDFEPDQNIPF